MNAQLRTVEAYKRLLATEGNKKNSYFKMFPPEFASTQVLTKTQWLLIRQDNFLDSR